MIKQQILGLILWTKFQGPKLFLGKKSVVIALLIDERKEEKLFIQHSPFIQDLPWITEITPRITRIAPRISVVNIHGGITKVIINRLTVSTKRIVIFRPIYLIEEKECSIAYKSRFTKLLPSVVKGPLVPLIIKVEF